jgi:hypothetical protein
MGKQPISTDNVIAGHRLRPHAVIHGRASVRALATVELVSLRGSGVEPLRKLVGFSKILGASRFEKERDIVRQFLETGIGWIGREFGDARHPPFLTRPLQPLEIPCLADKVSGLRSE